MRSELKEQIIIGLIAFILLAFAVICNFVFMYGMYKLMS